MQRIEKISLLLLGIVFILSGIAKFVSPESFSKILQIFLPRSFVIIPLYVLPIIEVYIGLCFIFRVNISYSLMTSILLISFFTILAYNSNLSKQLECGCFGSFFKWTFSSWFYIRNITLLFLLCTTVWIHFSNSHRTKSLNSIMPEVP